MEVAVGLCLFVILYPCLCGPVCLYVSAFIIVLFFSYGV